MTTQQSPVAMPATFRRELEAAERDNEIVRIVPVRFTPPSHSCNSWRIVAGHKGRTIELKASTIPKAWMQYQKVLQIIAERERPAAGYPKFAGKKFSEMLDAFLDGGGPDRDWSARTAKNRRSDFRPLHAAAKDILCRDVDAEFIESFINAAHTATVAKNRANITGTLLRWAAKAHYLTPAQGAIAVLWTPPENYIPAPTRREQATRHEVALSDSDRGNIMTPSQVSDYAREAGTRYVHGEALLQVAAGTGLRQAELIIATASEQVARSGQGNLVDLKRMLILVRRQANTGGTTKEPKHKRTRDTSIPPVNMMSTRFDVESWLVERCKMALVEQEAGQNPRALLFPNPQGDVWDQDTLRKSVLDDSADALGWRMEPYTTASGQTRAMRRFTMHSCRDFYATTAANVWGMSKSDLLKQGGWKNLATVDRFYFGVDDESTQRVNRLFGRDE